MKTPKEVAIMREARQFVMNARDHGMSVDSEIEFKDDKLHIKIVACYLPEPK